MSEEEIEQLKDKHRIPCVSNSLCNLPYLELIIKARLTSGKDHYAPQGVEEYMSWVLWLIDAIRIKESSINPAARQ